MILTPEFINQRSRVYLSGSEKAVRLFLYNYNLEVPDPQPLFWAHIYGGFLIMVEPLHLMSPTSDEAIRQANINCDHNEEYCWWMMQERALMFFRCHPRYHLSISYRHITFCGRIYTIPKELYEAAPATLPHRRKAVADGGTGVRPPTKN